MASYIGLATLFLESLFKAFSPVFFKTLFVALDLESSTSDRTDL